MARMLLITVLATLTGCQSLGVVLKATPTKHDPSKFEYSVEFKNNDR